MACKGVNPSLCIGIRSRHPGVDQDSDRTTHSCHQEQKHEVVEAGVEVEVAEAEIVEVGVGVEGTPPETAQNCSQNCPNDFPHYLAVLLFTHFYRMPTP